MKENRYTVPQNKKHFISLMSSRDFLRNCLLKSEFLREQNCNRLGVQSYFDHALNRRENVHWLFILTFPNGGSTALAKLLLTAPASRSLNATAEGQWLIPSLSTIGLPKWDSNYNIWQRKLRAVWLNRINNNQNENILVIEKSPPNMCRYENILSTFQSMKQTLVTFTRDPYATCASWHSRYGHEEIIRYWYPHAKELVKNEADYFNFLGETWLDRATMLLRARKDSSYDFSYEDFTENTSEVIANLTRIVPELTGVSSNTKVQVKNYEAQEITNMNHRQINSLTPEQIMALTAAFTKRPKVVEMLGYSLR